MTRLQKALEDKDNRKGLHGVQTKYDSVPGRPDIWAGCCPAFIGIADEDLDDKTMMGDYGAVTGCRGITCVECWNKELRNESI